MKIGVIGCSNIAETRVVPAILKVAPGSIKTVGTRDLNRAKFFCEKFSINNAGTYEDVINDLDIDIVYISSIPSTHEFLVKSALNKNKHVLCEKPLLINDNSINNIEKVLSYKKIVFLEGYMYQFHPQFTKILQIINSGMIGNIKLISTCLSYPAAKRKSFRSNLSSGGGVINDSMGYLVHSSLLLTNDSPKIVSITSCSDLMGPSSILIQFNGDSISSGMVSGNSQFCSDVKIIGTIGYISTSRIFSKGENEQVSIELRNGYDSITYKIDPADHYAEMWSAFLSEIRHPKGLASKWKEQAIALNNTFSLANCINN